MTLPISPVRPPERRWRFFLKPALLLALALPLSAHHSTAAFDMTKAVTIHGTVREFHWANPHSYILLDVEGANWTVEAEALNVLRRNGWTKDSLRFGDKIACTGARAKDPALLAMKCFTVTFPDGRQLVATPSGAPPAPSAPPRSDR